MLGRIVAAAAIIALAGCAGMESAGRNASRDPAPTRVAPSPAATTPAPAPAASLAPPQAVQTTPAPTFTTPPPQAAPPAPAPRVVASAPPPARAQTTPPPAATTPPPQAAAPVVTPSRNDDDDDNSTVVVPGTRERQVQPPNGDPRSNAERMQDIRAWDQCVMRVQGAAEADPMRPQLVTPEDYCRNSLGMSNRSGIPASRLERRR